MTFDDDWDTEALPSASGGGVQAAQQSNYNSGKYLLSTIPEHFFLTNDPCPAPSLGGGYNNGGRSGGGGGRRQDNNSNWRGSGSSGGGRGGSRDYGRRDDGPRDYGRRDDGPRDFGRRDQGPRNDRRDNNNFYGDNGGSSDAMEILYVGSYECPKIIGRGGSTIKDIESQFRVRINIGKQVDESGNKEVKITGRDEEAVLKAKERIESMVGGGSGGGYKAPVPSAPREFKLIDWDNLESKTLEYNMERFGHLPPVQKKFYTESEEVKSFTDAEVDAIRKRNNDIKVTRNFCEDVTRDIPKPGELL